MPDALVTPNVLEVLDALLDALAELDSLLDVWDVAVLEEWDVAALDVWGVAVLDVWDVAALDALPVVTSASCCRSRSGQL